MALKAKTVTREMVKILALGMEEGGEAAAKALPPVYAGDAPDYSLVDCWVQVPEITKDVDTFYIFSTSYVESSFAEGAPDYARLDNPEMVYGALDEYMSNASRVRRFNQRVRAVLPSVWVAPCRGGLGRDR